MAVAGAAVLSSDVSHAFEAGNIHEMLPPPLALLVGGVLVIGTCKLLFYAMDRGGKIFGMVFIGGFPIFFFGFMLILFCFLPESPSIFGFSIGSWHLPSLVPW